MKKYPLILVEVLALLAKEPGYTTVYRFPGGIISWQANGFEVKK